MTAGDGDQQRRLLNSKRQIHMDRTQTEHDMFGNFYHGVYDSSKMRHQDHHENHDRHDVADAPSVVDLKCFGVEGDSN